MKLFWMTVGTIIATGVAFQSPAHASVIPEMSLDKVFDQADIVVHGKVVDQVTQWEEYDGNRIIFTYSTIEPRSVLKSQAALKNRKIVVRTVGGTVDGYHQILVGEASFEVGEEVIAFLRHEEDWNQPAVVGFYQGKYRVERDESGQVRAVVRHKGQSPGKNKLVDREVPVALFAAQMRAVVRGEFKVTRRDDGTEVHPLVPLYR